MQNFLSNRPTKTVLVDAGTARFRVDLSHQAGHFAVLRVISDDDLPVTSAISDDFFDGVAAFDDGAWATALLQAKPLPARDVKILSVEIATAVMEVPFLGGESVQEAIAMELESLTDMSTAETQWTFKRLSGGEEIIRAWAIQASYEQLIAWRKAVEVVRGCHLNAVFHPAGIPLDAEVELELWPGFALYQEQYGNSRDIRGWIGGNVAASALADEAVRGAIANKSLLVLMGEGSLPAEVRGATTLRLDEEADRMRWAEQLARAMDPLSQKLETLPRLAIPKPVMSPKQLAFATGGIAVAVMLLAAVHFAIIQGNKNGLEERVASLREPVEGVRNAENEIRTLKRELRNLQSGPDDAPFDLDAHRARLASLLLILAKSLNEDVVMQSLDSKGLDVVVNGVSASSQGPANLVHSLNQGITQYDWRAKLIRREATLIAPDGGPWTFSVKMVPTAEGESPRLANNQRRSR